MPDNIGMPRDLPISAEAYVPAELTLPDLREAAKGCQAGDNFLIIGGRHT